MANIFAAGQSVTFSGELPSAFTFTAGSVRAVTIGAIGKVTWGWGAILSPGGHRISGWNRHHSYQRFVGIIAHDRGLFLTGVFLDDSVPVGRGPPTLNFTGVENFLALSPQLFQTFYIGNGLTGPNPGGTAKIFFVPPGATRLFLGIADGCLLADGPPGCYEDNKGTFVATAFLHSVSAQPTSK
jgi:hypothetical protein